MARIDPRLLKRLRDHLGLSRTQVYARIEAKSRELLLDRPQAALALALDSGLGITRYATSEDWAVLRQHRLGAPAVHHRDPVQPPTVSQPTRASRTQRKRVPQGPRNTVFVIHGRNARLLGELHSFLRAVGLSPIEWSQALRLAKKGSAHISEIIDAAFKTAAALVVLLSPDDEARLRREFWKPNEESYEKRLTKQARPNVLFEAGMAFGHKPDSTILVQVGKVKPFSDVAGRHVLHLTNSFESRKEFVIKLDAAGCDVDDSGTDWANVGDFRTK